MAALSFATVAIPAHAGLTANQLSIITPPTNALAKIMPPVGAVKAKSLPANSTASGGQSAESAEENLSGGGGPGTNLTLRITTVKTSGGRTISTLNATNSILNNSYKFATTTNLAKPFTLLQPLWLGTGTRHIHTEKYTNSTQNQFFKAVEMTLFLTNTSTTIYNGGQSGDCPGLYAGYDRYEKLIANGWGWAPDPSTTIHMVADGEGRTDTRIFIWGEYGDTYCDQTSVSIAGQPPSPAYRFVVYFPAGAPVPTGPYRILVNGFNP